jgi:hypothetical protein
MGGRLTRATVVVMMAVTGALAGANPSAARPPVGGPIPDGAGGLEQAPDLVGISQPGEVAARRTETSRTMVADDGTYETTFYDHPIHFRDANGAWQPIDTTLVPGSRPSSLRTKAAPVEVSLPFTLRSGPVRVARAATAVKFSLLGATGAQARTGVPPALGGRSEASTRSAATYAGALSGVDVVYTAMPEGVKEELVLAGPQAPTSFDFRLRLSAGLSAWRRPTGGWPSATPEAPSVPASGRRSWPTPASRARVWRTGPATAPPRCRCASWRPAPSRWSAWRWTRRGCPPRSGPGRWS